MNHNDPIPYREDIAKVVRERISNGVAVNVIIDEIQKFANAPKSRKTFYKLYGDDVAKVRAEFQNWLGEQAKKRIREGSDKILELSLRSKAGWNPSVKVEEVDSEDEDENQDAISVLMQKLGRETE